MKSSTFSVLLAGSLIAPLANAARERQALEAFDLSALQLEKVYVTEKCAPYASFRDPGGFLHRAFKGDYVGRNFGQVVELTETGIKLKEAIETTKGEWVERDVWLPLKQGSK